MSLCLGILTKGKQRRAFQTIKSKTAFKSLTLIINIIVSPFISNGIKAFN